MNDDDNTDDVKDLLGRAIGDEPPLGIDRDEVFRAGRQRVRRRRRMAAGSAVAAVVVAAVGATVLTNLVQTQEETPAASSRVQPAPPGPELPLTPTGSDASLPPATTPSSLSTANAAELTRALYASGIVTRKMALPWPGQPASPEFRVEDWVYLYEADVVSLDREGKVQVTVGASSPGSTATCADTGEEHDVCVTVDKYGTTVAQASWRSPEGEVRNVAVTVLPDGTKVAAVASNFSRREEESEKRPDGREPVLDMERLTKLILKSGFSVS